MIFLIILDEFLKITIIKIVSFKCDIVLNQDVIVSIIM